MGGCFEAEYDQLSSDDETGHCFSQPAAHTTVGVPPGKEVDSSTSVIIIACKNIPETTFMNALKGKFYTKCILYSEKFSLVQNFAELLPTALENIFVSFNFRTFFTWRPYLHRSISNFAVHIFTVPDLSAKNAKFCTMLKFPAIRYPMSLSLRTYTYLPPHTATGSIQDANGPRWLSPGEATAGHSRPSLQ